jgi:hypothetical protein
LNDINLNKSDKKQGLLNKAINVFKQKSKNNLSAGIDIGELAVTLAKQAAVPELQAELARNSLKFEMEDQLWEFEKVDQEESDRVIMKTGFSMSFKNLEKVQLVTILCVAETLSKQFGGSMWVDNNTGRLEMGWCLGQLDKLSEKSSIKKFEMAYAFVTSTKAQFLESFGEAAFRKPD